MSDSGTLAGEEAGANGGTKPGFYVDGQSGSLHLESVRYYSVS